MALIALKIDVDTWRGTREGVPNLMRALDRHGVRATFLFSLGPDHTGRAIVRALRPGFLRKVSRTSVIAHYGLRTLLHGTLLPGPDIGRREAQTMRTVRAAGFEVGVHCWDHVRWQDHLSARDGTWARRQMQLARQRFIEIFGEPPRLHGAAGWQFNDAAACAETELGFEYASDTRGHGPFQPVAADGSSVGPPQFPTTLPTLDELLGIDGHTADTVHRTLLAQTEAVDRDQVYTLHAELEGLSLQPVFDRLIDGWRAQGHTPAALDRVRAAWRAVALPGHRIEQRPVPGRSGVLAVQGRACEAARSRAATSPGPSSSGQRA